MQHFFITKAETLSPRWQQAFPKAQLLFSAQDLSVISAQDVVWLLLDGDDWEQLLELCVATQACVIAMTRLENIAQAKRALELGACGYIHFLAIVAVLKQVSQVVQRGGLWLGADLMRSLVLSTAVPKASTPDSLLDQLTPREKAVAEAVAAGKTNKEVARVLDITERTVKAHLGAAFEKLGVRDRLHLALVVSGKLSD